LHREDLSRQLKEAVEEDDVTKQECVVRRGTDLEVILPGNVTPLQLAAKRDHVAVGRLLLQKGAKNGQPRPKQL
jgi:hypothetical protein